MPNPAELIGIISALSGNQAGGNQDILSVLAPLLAQNKGQEGGGQAGGGADALKMLQDLASKKKATPTPIPSFLSPKLEDAICSALSSFCSKCSAEEKYFQEQISMLKSNSSLEKGVPNV